MQEKENFKNYISSFLPKLDNIVVDDISAGIYWKKKLSYLLQHKMYYLSIYADVLHKLIQHSSIRKASISLLDYGAGNGLLGIFAKFCGFKNVYTNDLDRNSLRASEMLAQQMDIKIDGFIQGDILAVQAFFKNQPPNAIVGTDVIEHIYSLETFFSVLAEINPSISAVFTTASNPDNYLKVRKLKKIQLKDELNGGTYDDYLITGESPLEPFIKMREQIIREHTDTLPYTVILELVNATRGMNKQDIGVAVEQYKISGRLPNPLEHETNTCNPLTSSWTERILSIKEYIILYNSVGFSPTFYNGFYNGYEGGVNKYVKKMLNVSIALLGNKISPYIIIVS